LPANVPSQLLSNASDHATALILPAHSCWLSTLPIGKTRDLRDGQIQNVVIPSRSQPRSARRERARVRNLLFSSWWEHSRFSTA